MPNQGAQSDRSPTAAGVFATTHWSVVLTAGETSSQQAAEALEKLCRVYWYPLYAYVRRQGHGPPNGKTFAKMFAQVAFSPKGDQLALASVDAAIELWDLKSLQKSRALKGHTGPIISLVFSPDGAGLISASVDGSIRIWDLRPESPDHIPNAHSDRIWSVALSPDGRSLASAGWDGKVKLWDIETWTNKATLNGFRHQVFCVAFAPDGRTLAASGGDQFDWDQSGEIKVWDLEYKMLDLSRALQLVLWAQEVSRQEATFKLKFSLLWQQH